MPSISCPDDLELALFVRGPVPDSSQERFEEHLSDCDLCRQRTSQLVLVLGRERRYSARPIRIRKWQWAAAAGLLLAAAGYGLWGSSSRSTAAVDPGPIPLGRPTPGLSEAFQTGEGQQEFLSLRDGTRLRLGERTSMAFVPPDSGERTHIRLQEGMLELFSPKGRGGIRISGAAGEVRVIGTHFTTRAFELSGEDILAGFRGGPVLCVGVAEGKVALRNGRGEILLGAGRRGILFPDAPPIEQERAGSRADAIRLFLQAVEPDGSGWKVRPGQDDFARVLAATFWGSGWGERTDEEPETPLPLRNLFKGAKGSR